jgi:phosphoglycerate dehydrogenase-like enzyme
MSGTVKVVSLRSEADYKNLGVIIPPGVEVAYNPVTEPDAIVEAAKNADVLLLAIRPPITASIIERLPNLKLIQVSAIGYDNVDIDAAAAKGIPVANAQGSNREAVTELTLLMALAHCRRLIVADRGLKQGKYTETGQKVRAMGMVEFKDLTFGIVGLGDIGKCVASRLKAFETRVLYYDIIRPTAAEERELGVTYVPFEELLKTSDIVTLHVSLNKTTRHMISTPQLNLMKPSALLVNASRGPVVDSNALAKALAELKIGGAALDVHETEPLPPDSPLLSLSDEASDRLILAPHIAGTSSSAVVRMLQYALDNCGRLARGEKPVAIMNGVKV